MAISKEILTPENGSVIIASGAEQESAARFWSSAQLSSLAVSLFGTLTILHELKAGNPTGEMTGTTIAALGAISMYWSGTMLSLYRPENID